MASSQKWVFLGKVLREWGVKGHVKCESFNPESTLFSESDTLFLQTPEGYRAFSVEQVQPHDKYWRLKLQGVDSPEAAKKFRGYMIALPREALPPLKEGEFYLEDLIGFSVEAFDDKPLGNILAWETIGDSQVFLVGKDMKSACRVPYEKEFIAETLMDKKKIKLKAAAKDLF